ncbi:MAG: ammonium transporter [Nitrososphaeraceae archaeon]|nr:ammonium transporter [Nitrososphaeraceae archaeon]
MALDTGDTAWMIVATGLVMLMTPGLGFFMSGLIRFKNGLSAIMHTFSGLAILSTLWFIVGFTLVFGPTQGGIIGGIDHVFYHGVKVHEGFGAYATIPGVTYATYQMMFAVITPLLIAGAFAERIKYSAFFIFAIAWSLFVYFPLAHWIWGGGWLAQLGVWDFAGGIVIHTSAGMAAIAAGLVFGRRKNYGPQIMVPHNLPLAVIGATMLWLGWFGFNAGSALAANGVAGNALLTSQIGSATCTLVWLFLSWKRSGKPSIAAVINGAISGLAGITPTAGYISGESAFVLGIILGFGSYYGIVLLKEKLRIDDALDVGSVHGITGILGALAIGVAASPLIMEGGPVGWLHGNPAQLGIQAFGVAVAAVFAFSVSVAIFKIIDKTIGLKISDEEEEAGLDITQHAEKAFND